MARVTKYYFLPLQIKLLHIEDKVNVALKIGTPEFWSISLVFSMIEGR